MYPADGTTFLIDVGPNMRLRPERLPLRTAVSNGPVVIQPLRRLVNLPPDE